ncbi:hypothetical protein WSK_3184 [Novosphingobium sp. Rr 2-17]|uniref:hypothetical protein n=1 Tax=Novosphingobium sp. Rr 2-17 TaxID=555793 RepID=UPI000269856D|nr:hypothetical protein [Novosphingobium sp. Rr 2-17]EIZ78209.1 hypothetical protein WSK_3184 [Novosphingobium sp. Rr 2-17]
MKYYKNSWKSILIGCPFFMGTVIFTPSISYAAEISQGAYFLGSPEYSSFQLEDLGPTTLSAATTAHSDRLVSHYGDEGSGVAGADFIHADSTATQDAKVPSDGETRSQGAPSPALSESVSRLTYEDQRIYNPKTKSTRGWTPGLTRMELTYQALNIIDFHPDRRVLESH